LYAIGYNKEVKFSFEEKLIPELQIGGNLNNSYTNSGDIGYLQPVKATDV
jgi:hypothetical protein